MATALATKADVEEIVGRVVGGIVSDALELISERFDRQDIKIDALRDDVEILKIDVRELKTDVTILKNDVIVLKNDVTTLKADIKDLKRGAARIESKQDISAARLDDHELRLKLLENSA